MIQWLDQFYFTWQEYEVLRMGLNAVRCFLGVHKYTAKCAINGDMGWESCLMKQRLWIRLVESPEERLTKNMFKLDRAHGYPCVSAIRRCGISQS